MLTLRLHIREGGAMEVVNELMVRGIVVGVFQENCWVVGNRRTGEGICIDPGDQPDEVLALAKDLGVTIKAIANSHAHIDHVMGVRGVNNATGAKFFLHHDDLSLLQNGWRGSAERFGIDISQGPPDPDHFLKDGDVVEVEGLKLQTLATPGHTPGSISFYTEGMVFSGDTLFRGSIGRTDLPGGDMNQELASIAEKLLSLPDDTMVLPGHMEQTTVAFEKRAQSVRAGMESRPPGDGRAKGQGDVNGKHDERPAHGLPRQAPHCNVDFGDGGRAANGRAGLV